MQQVENNNAVAVYRIPHPDATPGPVPGGEKFFFFPKKTLDEKMEPI